MFVYIAYPFTSLRRNCSQDFSKNSRKDFGSIGKPVFINFSIGNM